MTEEQYYRFRTSVKPHSLHVVDADHGVFESKNQPRRRKFKLGTSRFLKKFTTPRSLESITLENSSELNLRPEPELVSILSSRRNNFNEPPINVVDNSDVSSFSDNGFFDEDIERISINQSGMSNSYQKSNSKYDRSQNSKSLLSQFQEFKNDNSPTEYINLTNMNGGSLDTGYKSKLELEYEEMKSKAARYKMERDMMRLKNENAKTAQKLREYEYYCINGINRNNIGTDNFMAKDSLPRQVYAVSQLPITKRRRLQTKTSKTIPHLPSSGINDDFFNRLSKNLPDEIVSTLNYYGDYIPSTNTIREFHKAVLIWVSSIPFISIIYPILYLVGQAIPKHSNRSWSIRALTVGILDMIVLIISGWSVYQCLSWTMLIIARIIQISRFFKII